MVPSKYEAQLLRSGQSHLDVEFVVDEWEDLLPEEAILQVSMPDAGKRCRFLAQESYSGYFDVPFKTSSPVCAC
jgi:hypothetical protein